MISKPGEKLWHELPGKINGNELFPSILLWTEHDNLYKTFLFVLTWGQYYIIKGEGGIKLT